MSSNDANIEFSGNNKKNDTDNFQTANMIYKMKTVKDKRNKKPRKRKVKNNFKNLIQLLMIFKCHQSLT